MTVPAEVARELHRLACSASHTSRKPTFTAGEMADEDAIRKQQWLEERRKQHQQNMAQRRRARP